MNSFELRRKYFERLILSFVVAVGVVVAFISLSEIGDKDFMNSVGLIIIGALLVAYVVTSIIIDKLFGIKKEYRGAYLSDLIHLGATEPHVTYNFASQSLVFTFDDEVLGVNLFEGLVIPHSKVNRFKALLSYGMPSLVKKLHSSDTFLGLANRDSAPPENDGSAPELQILVYETVSAAKKFSKIRKLDIASNPIPYAAYLFRMASLHNNPKDKDIQEKAFILWFNCKTLELAVELRAHSLEAIRELAVLPDSWIREVNNYHSNTIEGLPSAIG